MSETCHDCYEEFNGFRELAQHIVSQKSTHSRKSRVWALHFLAEKKNVVSFNGRTPFSEETKQIIKDCVRELSGESEVIKTLCPNCKTLSNQRIEAEFIRDGEVWRNSMGTLIVDCLGCKNK